MKYDAIRISALKTVTFPVIGVAGNANFFAKKILGLTAPDININMVNIPKQGGAYYDSTPELREIEITVGLEPNYALNISVEQARASLYWMVNSQLTIELLLNGVVKLKTYGWLKRLESDQFEREPELDIVISCISATFDAPSETLIGAGATGASVSITLAGSAKTNLIIDWKVQATASGFLTRRYFNGDVDNYQEFRVDGLTFLNNDTIRLDSTSGKKKALRVRGGVFLNLLPYITPTSTWLYLEPDAPNVIDASLIGGSSSTAWNVNSVKYTNKYWGV